MFRILITLLLSAIVLVSCSDKNETETADEVNPEITDEISLEDLLASGETIELPFVSINDIDNNSTVDDSISDENTDYREGMFSHRNIIVSVDMTRKDEIQKVFSDMNLSIVYELDNLSMYVVKTEKDVSYSELDRIIKELEKYDFIFMAEKDGAIELDDSSGESITEITLD